MFFGVGRKLTKSCGVRVDRTFEGPDSNLIVIAGIDADHIRIRNQCVPVLRGDISTDDFLRVDIRNTHGDDFLLEFDPCSQERPNCRLGLFVHQLFEAIICLEESH